MAWIGRATVMVLGGLVAFHFVAGETWSGAATTVAASMIGWGLGLLLVRSVARRRARRASGSGSRAA